MMATTRTAAPRRTTRRRPRKKRHSPLRYIFSVLLLSALVALMAFALRGGYNTFVRSTYELEHYDTVMAACEDFGIEPSLAYGIIRTESGFNEQALSSANAKGLMQITASALEWIQLRCDEFDDVTDEALYDPEINIRCGVYLLSLLFEQFDSEQAVIAAYNAGLGNVESWLQNDAYSADGITLDTIPFEETRNYVTRVQSSKAIYEHYYHLDDSKGEDDSWNTKA